MTSIIGNLADSGLSAFNAKLYVTLDGTIVIDTTPKTILVPKTKIIDIAGGQINFALDESETDNVTYSFVLYEFANNNIVEPPILSFRAIVPNESSVDFADLVPTGFVNSQIDSGARRIAKLIISNEFFTTGIKDLSKPVISLESNVVQSSSSSTTVISFNVEKIDSNGIWANDRATIPPSFGGNFILSGTLPIQNATGVTREFQISIRRNGSVIIPIIKREIPANKSLDVYIPSTIIQLVAGDYIDLILETSGGFSFTVETIRKRFNMYRLPI